MAFHLTSSAFDLQSGHLLADCRTRNGTLMDSSLDLNAYLGNNNGRFEWGGRNFSSSARNLSYTVDRAGFELHAELRTRNGEWRPASIPLHTRISNRNGHLAVVADPLQDIAEGFSHFAQDLGESIFGFASPSSAGSSRTQRAGSTSTRKAASTPSTRDHIDADEYAAPPDTASTSSYFARDHFGPSVEDYDSDGDAPSGGHGGRGGIELVDTSVPGPAMVPASVGAAPDDGRSSLIPTSPLASSTLTATPLSSSLAPAYAPVNTPHASTTNTDVHPEAVAAAAYKDPAAYAAFRRFLLDAPAGGSVRSRVYPDGSRSLVFEGEGGAHEEVLVDGSKPAEGSTEVLFDQEREKEEAVGRLRSRSLDSVEPRCLTPETVEGEEDAVWVR